MIKNQHIKPQNKWSKRFAIYTAMKISNILEIAIKQSYIIYHKNNKVLFFNS